MPLKHNMSTSLAGELGILAKLGLSNASVPIMATDFSFDDQFSVKPVPNTVSATDDSAGIPFTNRIGIAGVVGEKPEHRTGIVVQVCFAHTIATVFVVGNCILRSEWVTFFTYVVDSIKDAAVSTCRHLPLE